MTPSDKKDLLEDVLFMCGFTLKKETNPACVACLTNPDHTRYLNCRDISGNINPLARLYCTINYYKSKDIHPPLDFKQTLNIITWLSEYLHNHDYLPPEFYDIKMTITLSKTGLTVEKAAQEYRINALSFIDKMRNM